MKVVSRPLISGILQAGLVSALTLSFLTATGQEAAHPDRASWVNPLIGTTNGGNVFPGATMPFGMVQFSPENSPVNSKNTNAAPGGYEYRSKKIR